MHGTQAWKKQQKSTPDEENTIEGKIEAMTKAEMEMLIPTLYFQPGKEKTSLLINEFALAEWNKWMRKG